MKLLEGKVAIVTGSTGGIGKSIASYLASKGAQVVVTSRDLGKAKDVASEIIKNGGDSFPCQYVLEDPESGKILLDQVIAQYKQLDILVNNAFSHPALPAMAMEKMNYQNLQLGITTNLTNVLELIILAFKHLKITRGNVLNIGSVVVNRNMLGIPLYAIVKGALTQATKVLAAEWAKDGICVNQINPGFVQTDAFKNIGVPEDYHAGIIEHYRQFHPTGRIGVPSDISSLAALMVSDETSWMTGAIVDVDGGFSVQGVPKASN